MTRFIATIAAVVALAATVVAQAGAGNAAEKANLVQTLAATGQFKTLVSLITKAGLAKTLSRPGPYTVFAPTDAAFAKVPKSTVSALLADKAKLRTVLLYHVVPGRISSSQVARLSSVKTASGKEIHIRVKGGQVFVNNATVTKADVTASNGVIHVVNRVLIPPAR
ncbi:MAG: hypothetical protein C4305_03235 [Thermoleophilia bacterium]